MTSRLALLAGTVLTFVVVAVPSAFAAGVGGIEVTPPNGTSFRLEVPEGESATQTFTLSNVSAEPSTVRLYGASAQQSPDGAWSAGAADSADWLELEDQQVTLAPGESRELSFVVEGGAEDRTGAIVVEQATGTVVQRAATLVYVEAASPLPLPLLLLAVAIGLMAVAAAAVAAAARRRRSAETA